MINLSVDEKRRAFESSESSNPFTLEVEKQDLQVLWGDQWKGLGLDPKPLPSHQASSTDSHAF